MRRMVGLESTKILKFIRENFDRVIPEERGSLELSFERGEILYIIGFDGKGENHHMVAAIMYVSCAERSYLIGLLSVTKFMIVQGLGSQLMVSHFVTWV